MIEIDGVSTSFSSVIGGLFVFIGGAGSYKQGDVRVTNGVALSVDAATARRTVRIDGALGIVKPGTQVTASRPAAASAGKGAMFYDETLNLPIFSDGAAWRNAAGIVV